MKASCPDCDKEVELIEKMNCWICSECRLVVEYRDDYDHELYLYGGVDYEEER